MLHLRDMKKPITVLTGMDYWLDNLMSNVPELVMCFHVNGIVKVQCYKAMLAQLAQYVFTLSEIYKSKD